VCCAGLGDNHWSVVTFGVFTGESLVVSELMCGRTSFNVYLYDGNIFLDQIVNKSIYFP